MFNNWIYTHYCRLEDGRITGYDAMSQTSPDAYPKEEYEYVGKGFIYEINGKRYYRKVCGYFFQKI